MVNQCYSGIDAEVLGLWAKIEKAIYDGLEPGKVNGQQNEDEDVPRKGGLDGYHHEFVANLER